MERSRREVGGFGGDGVELGRGWSEADETCHFEAASVDVHGCVHIYYYLTLLTHYVSSHACYNVL